MFAALASTIMVLAICSAGTGFCSDSSAKESLTNVSFPELAMEFRELRIVKGHFDGGPWLEDVDRWMGRKYRVMEALRQRIDVREIGRPQLVEQLGAPDRILNETDPMFLVLVHDRKHCIHDNGSRELLVYHWRGSHDVLYFIASGNILIHSDWWHAGD